MANSYSDSKLTYLDIIDTWETAKIEFGLALREARLASGMTQETLANRMDTKGVTNKTISHWELGKRDVQPHLKRKLETIFIELGIDLTEDASSRTAIHAETTVDTHENIAHRTRSIPEIEYKHSDFNELSAYSAIPKPVSRPKITSAILKKSSSDITDAITAIIQYSGTNRLPEGLEALEKIPFAILSVAESLDEGDHDALIEYIKELERQNRELREQLEKLQESWWRIFKQNSAKSMSSWQAFTVIGGAVMSAVGVLDLSPVTELFDVIEGLNPDKQPPTLLETWEQDFNKPTDT